MWSRRFSSMQTLTLTGRKQARRLKRWRGNLSRKTPHRPPDQSGWDRFSFLFSDPDADDRLVAAILYGAAQLPMDDALGAGQAAARRPTKSVS